jgi:hypothetical protein
MINGHLGARRQAIVGRVLIGLLVLIAGCSSGSKVDTAARNRCEAKWGVGNCVERSTKWVPLAAATTTIPATAAPTTTAAPPTAAPTTLAPPPTTVPLTTIAPTTAPAPVDLAHCTGGPHCERGWNLDTCEGYLGAVKTANRPASSGETQYLFTECGIDYQG